MSLFGASTTQAGSWQQVPDPLPDGAPAIVLPNTPTEFRVRALTHGQGVAEILHETEGRAKSIELERAGGGKWSGSIDWDPQNYLLVLMEAARAGETGLRPGG